MFCQNVIHHIRRCRICMFHVLYTLVNSIRMMDGRGAHMGSYTTFLSQRSNFHRYQLDKFGMFGTSLLDFVGIVSQRFQRWSLQRRRLWVLHILMWLLVYHYPSKPNSKWFWLHSWHYLSFQRRRKFSVWFGRKRVRSFKYSAPDIASYWDLLRIPSWPTRQHSMNLRSKRHLLILQYVWTIYRRHRFVVG